MKLIFYLIALAVWLSNLRRKSVSYVLLVVYVLLNLGTFWHNWTALDVKTKPGMAGAAKFLETNVGTPEQMPGRLFVGSSFEFFNLKYYLSKPLPPVDTVDVFGYIRKSIYSNEGNCKID